MDHLATNSSPFTSSRTKTSAFNAMIDAVITGKRLGCRDSSASGIMSSLYDIVPETSSQADAGRCSQETVLIRGSQNRLCFTYKHSAERGQVVGPQRLTLEKLVRARFENGTVSP
jgi:hypothetical protein